MEKSAKKGTTTVGVIYKDGVVIAADQLATLGDIKVNQKIQKVIPITKNVVMTTAGMVGDNQAIVRLLKAQMKLYILEETEPTVNSVATLLSNILSDKYLYSYLPYQLQDLIGGYDTKARLYSMDMVGGIGEEHDVAATGSGMTVAYGILDAGYKKNMTEEQAVKLAVQAIVSARKRISSVGGENVTVYVVDSKGAREISPDKIKKLVDNC